MAEINNINLSKIDPPEHDGRFEIDSEADQELVSSIKLIGVLEPLIVRKKNKRIEIIAGSRRYRCSKIAGLDSVPCIITTADDALSERIKLHENLKRKDLSHIDQGMTFARLHTELKLTENEISEITGKSIPYISQHLNLIMSSEELIRAVQDEKVTFSVARELMHIENKPDQLHLLKYAMDGGASVETVKQWVRTASNERIQSEDTKPLEMSETNYPAKTLPTFLCDACEHPSLVSEMKVRRLCPQCDFLIFDEIRQEKEKQASNSS